MFSESDYFLAECAFKLEVNGPCLHVCVPPQGRPLFLQSSRNVSVNVVDGNNQLLTQLVTGEEPTASHTWPPQRTQHSPADS